MATSRANKIVAMVVVLIGLAIGLWLVVFKPASHGSKKEQPAKAKFFSEAAISSGLKFQMSFLPDEQGGKFKINLYDHGCGLAIGDYDGDGHDDIYFVNQLGSNRLYRSKGDGTFEDMTEAAGVALGDRIGVAATFADYDNDGKQDLFVTSVRGGNVLFHNEGNGKFREVTKEAGVEQIGHCQSGHFFDYDKDGHLDLFVISTAQWTLAALDPQRKYYPGKTTYFETAGSEKEFNKLFRNNGNGTFKDVTAQSGLSGMGWAGDAAVFDHDGDGWLDVVITNMFGRSQLFRNKGDGTFLEVTKEVLGPTPWGGMGVLPLDFNNDGLLDLFIVDMHSDMWLPFDADLTQIDDKKKSPKPGPDLSDIVQLRPDEVVFGNTFFKNLGHGKFAEVTDAANLETFWPWGIGCGDFDNDGFPDLFITSGMGYPFAYWPNYLMMNNGAGSFVDRAEQFDIEPPTGGYFLKETIAGRPAPRSSRAVGIADFNGDGRLDIVTNNFNDHPYYFKNLGAKGHYLALRLVGTGKSNRDAIGAVVRLYAGKDIMTRQVNPACGYLAQSSTRVHFGLGERTRIDKIEITWPSGLRQNLPIPPLDASHVVIEPKP